MFGFKAISVHKIVSAAVVARDYSSNLILSLTGESGYGTGNGLIFDRSVNAATVTKAGDAAQIVSSYSPFSSGWSYYFDGTGDYITVARNAAFFPTANTDFTIEAWVYLTATPGATNAQIVGAGEYGTDADWVLNINSSLTVQIYVQSSNVTYTGGTVTLNTWNHIAVSRSGTASNNFRVFVNGTGTSYSVNNTLVGVGNRVLSIGADQNGDESNITGYISNLRMINGTALYTANFTPSTTALTAVANTSLLTCHSSRLVDGSSNDADISVNGNVTASTFAPFDKTVLSGTIGDNSIFFNGSSALVSLTAASTFSDFGTGDFTVECWAYRTGAGTGNRVIIGRGISSVGAINWVLRWASTGNLQLILNTSSNTPSTVHDYSYAFPLNTWVHLAVTRSGTTSKLFVDGTEVSSTTNSTNVNSAGNTPVIGGDSVQGSYFQGYISNVRVVKGSAVYSGSFTRPTGALTAVSGTSLLTARSVIFEDLTSNVTVSSTNATISIFNPFGTTGSIPGSLYFDGTNDYLTIPASAALNVFGGDFTIECWFNPISFNASNYNYLIMQDDGGSNSQNFQLKCSAAGIASFTTWNTSSRGSVFEITSTRSVKLGAWNHIAVTHVKSTNTTRLFVNGRLESSSTTAIWAGSASVQTCLGNWSTGAAIQNSTYGKLNGYMSGVRLVKGSALYTAAFSVPTSIPTAVSGTALLLNFNDGCNPDAYGSSGAFFTTNTGVVTNLAIKKSGTGSIYFPATYMATPANPDFALGTGDFTIEFWLYSSITNNSKGLLTIASSIAGGSGVGSLGIAFNTNIPAAIDFLISGATTAGSINISNASWTHVALCRSAGTVRLFVGGVLSTSAASSTNLTGQILTLGATTSTATPFTGYIDNLVIYKGYAKYTSDTTFTPV